MSEFLGFLQYMYMYPSFQKSVCGPAFLEFVLPNYFN